MKHTILTIIVVAAITGFWQSTAHAESPDDILVVANSSLTMNSVSSAELKAIFLKQNPLEEWGQGDPHSRQTGIS